MTIKTVWKYKLSSDCEIEIPEGAKLLYTREQWEGVYLWALVDPECNKLVKRRFKIYKTGRDIENSENLTYIGTAMRNSGNKVLHVFEVKQ